MIYEDNWKEHPGLSRKIKSLEKLHTEALANKPRPLVRTAVCRHSDEIKIEIPCTYNKAYYAAEEFARSIGKHENIRDIHLVSFHISELDNICTLLHCIGEKIGYGISLEHLKYPEVVDFLNHNHPMYALADAITVLLDEYNKTPSVYYASPVAEARATINQFRKLQTAKVNEIYTNAIGAGRVTVRWKSEYKLYALVKKLYPDAVFQFRAQWLKQQSLDIYIPSIKTAVEYQGIQHYKAVDHFGGDAALQGVVERDIKKLNKCENEGIRLIYWKHDVPITLENLNNALRAE